ncbi:hypothetical protein G6L13_05455 [Agrobacterium tumefaciens]|uniref:hypothetical protein n=1 Tax=Agrobacterium tumefaciens TaxID=358 RepID=UPI0015747B90|nr:hypothetical protein [Agrobacterium tumefaciens]NTA79931.1 hypothetical protein [Agrobacterium tumefaciens]
MTNVIMDTGNVNELLGAEHDDEGVSSSMEARKEAEGNGIEFHVAMTSWTLRDMEELIVQAAAQQLVGKFGNDRLAKEIEAKTISLVTAKADATLEAVTTEIINQPLIPKYTYGKADADPVTMREFLGLTGRQYLTQMVGSDGKVSDRSSYNEKSRVQYLVEKCMETTFKREIEKATNELIAEVRRGVEAKHKAFLEAEKARFREALEKISA